MKLDRIGLKNAVNGIHAAVKSERNLKIHILIGIIAVTLGFICSINVYEWLALVITIGIVMMTEVMNTAVEKAVNISCKDILEKELNKNPVLENAKLAKDIAAGAVLVTAVMALAVGMIIFIPKLFCLY